MVHTIVSGRYLVVGTETTHEQLRSTELWNSFRQESRLYMQGPVLGPLIGTFCVSVSQARRCYGVLLSPTSVDCTMNKKFIVCSILDNPLNWSCCGSSDRCNRLEENGILNSGRIALQRTDGETLK